jgi:hypothetical protein
LSRDASSGANVKCDAVQAISWHPTKELSEGVTAPLHFAGNLPGILSALTSLHVHTALQCVAFDMRMKIF